MPFPPKRNNKDVLFGSKLTPKISNGCLEIWLELGRSHGGLGMEPVGGDECRSLRATGSAGVRIHTLQCHFG